MRKIYNQKLKEDWENRIILTTPSYFAGLRIFYVLLFLLLACSIGALLYFGGVSIAAISVAAGLTILTFLLLLYVKNQSWVVSIKDDAIIHTRADDRSFVTSVKSIGKLRSFRIIGFVVTKYTWNLDGMYKSSIIIGKYEGNDNTPKVILKEVINKYKKNKANHKPGSVIAV